MPRFPNIVHLVWHGDFPKKFVGNLSRICAMAADNYQVVCWVNHPKTFLESFYNYDNNGICMGHLPRNLTISNSSKIIELLLKSDISCKREIVRIIELEAAGAAYNYSTISDFLRFLCLYFYGGIYLDFDSIPLEKFPPPSQIRAMGEPTQDMLIICVNSNILISMPEHEILYEILQNMVALYRKGSAYPQYFGMTWLDAKRVTKPGRWSNSIELGPAAAQAAIESYSKKVGLTPKHFYLQSKRTKVTDAEKRLIPSYSDQTGYFMTPALGKLVFYYANSWLGVPIRTSTYEDITDPHRNKGTMRTPQRLDLMLQQKSKLLRMLIDAALNEISTLIAKPVAPGAKCVTPTELQEKFEALKDDITLKSINDEAAWFECIDRFLVCLSSHECCMYNRQPGYNMPRYIQKYLPYIYIILSKKYMKYTREEDAKNLQIRCALLSGPNLEDPRTSSKKSPTLSTSKRLLEDLMKAFG